MTNDTNKNEPLDLEEIEQRVRCCPTLTSHLLIHPEDLDRLTQEIERLREELKRIYQITATIAKNYNNEIKTPTIHRCGSCDNWSNTKLNDADPDSKRMCKITRQWWGKDEFCSSHPDWKEPGKG